MRTSPEPIRARVLFMPAATYSVFTVAILALCASQAAAQARIVNGLTTHAYPTTGQLLFSGGGNISTSNAGSWCSGTLIGCHTFLTAAHCVDGDTDPNHYWVYLQNYGIAQVIGVNFHPSFSFPVADVAVLELSTDVTGIDPTEINVLASPHNIGFGLAGDIAGFGRTGGNNDDYGIKREGSISTASCSGSAPSGNTELVCWNYQAPVGAAGDDSNTCNGDSGGPLFMDLGAGTVVAGITSGGNNSSCLPTDSSYDANVYTYRAFIQTELGADSTTNCGSIPPVGDAGVDVIGNSGTLSGTNPDDSYVVNVPVNVQELRFGFNGEDNGAFRVDYYVKHGLGASASSFDCKEDGTTNFGGCSFASPANGDWSVYVDRTAGSGEYQVTTTRFGGDPPICGNVIKEPGEDCDGTDDASCPTLCQLDCMCPAPLCGNGIIELGEVCDSSDPGTCPTATCGGDCNCPPPVCGNDIVETGEDCDGTSDGACPGQCDGGCGCPQACFQDDIVFDTVRMRSDFKRIRVKFNLDSSGGDYLGMRPDLEAFDFVASQGGAAASVSLLAGDIDWSRSNPAKGKFVWKSKLHSSKFRWIKLLDKTAKKGYWKVRMTGKEVPGADGIDVLQTVHLQMSAGGICTERDW